MKNSNAITKYKRFASWLPRPYVMVPLLFGFLLIRNWPVFLVWDARDGFFLKTLIVTEGFDFHSFASYIRNVALKSWAGHFKPIWLLSFYGISYFFDSNPWVLGFISFSLAAILLYLIFRISYHFVSGHKNAYLYALMVALAFSSSSFFLETITWKWMTCLLMSSVFFCFALLVLLEKILAKPYSTKWLILYIGALFGCYWSYGPGWVLGWGLVFFLLLSGYRLKDRIAWMTIVATIIGTVPTIIVNRGDTPPISLLFLAVNVPANLVLGAANMLLQTLGVFRFADVQFIRASSVLALTLIAALSIYYYARYKEKKFEQKDALVVSLLLAYVGIVALSLLRLTPVRGINPTSSPDNYIIGGRYLFIYSVPLMLALAVGLGDKIVKLPRSIFYVFLCGFLLFGIVMQIGYKKIDPDIQNRHRTDFYNLMPKALHEAKVKKLPLPDVSGDLFWQGYQYKLSYVIDIRKDMRTAYHPKFEDASKLTADECRQINNSNYIRDWLNLYSQDWCQKGS